MISHMQQVCIKRMGFAIKLLINVNSPQKPGYRPHNFETTDTQRMTPISFQLSPCRRDFHEKLIVAELSKNILPFYGSRMFSTVFTRARHLSLS
jgi:hypothetical protein